MSNFDFFDRFDPGTYAPPPPPPPSSSMNTIIIGIAVILVIVSIIAFVVYFSKRKSSQHSQNDSPFATLIYTQNDDEMKKDLQEWERLWVSCGRENVKNKIVQLARGGGGGHTTVPNLPMHPVSQPQQFHPQPQQFHPTPQQRQHFDPPREQINQPPTINDDGDNDDDDDDEIAEL